MNQKLEADIQATIRKMLYPSPLMAWAEGLEQAERIGRIKRSKLGTLRYIIRQFVRSQLPDLPEQDYKITVDPDVDEIHVIGQGTLHCPPFWKVTTTYPDWLLDFLEPDENFELMLPDSDEKLQEVLQRIHEWCYNNPPYDLLVKPTKVSVQ